jgi:hypothetical protein
MLLLLHRFGRLDHLPELGILLQGFVLLDLQAGAIEKILERVAMQDAMDEHAEFMALKINPVVAHAKAMEDAPAAFEFAEVVQFGADHLLGQPAEIAQDLELEFLGQAGHFGGAGGREYDLKRSHVIGSAYGSRTRPSGLRIQRPNR